MSTYPHDGDPVAQLDGLVDVVGDHDDRLAQLALQSEEELMQLAANDRIHRRERLIHEHDQRVGRERPCYAHPLLLPAGQLDGIAVRELPLQTDAVEQLRTPASRSFSWASGEELERYRCCRAPCGAGTAHRSG